MNQNRLSSFLSCLILLLVVAGCDHPTSSTSTSEEQGCAPFETTNAKHKCVCQKEGSIYSPDGEAPVDSWAHSPDGTLEAGWTSEGRLGVRKVATGTFLWLDRWKGQRKFLVWHPDGDAFFTGDHYAAMAYESSVPNRDRTSIQRHQIFSPSYAPTGLVTSFIHMAFFDPDTMDQMVYAESCYFRNDLRRIPLPPDEE